MKQNALIEKKIENGLLIGLTWGASVWEIEENLAELSDLVAAAGGIVIDKIIQNRIKPDSAFFIGRGKVAELVEMIDIREISTLVFVDELSPAQVKNLENMLKIKVLDRSAVILDIFADHAKTKEAKTLLGKINDLKNQEDAELEIWRNGLNDIERKLNFIDQTLFEPKF